MKKLTIKDLKNMEPDTIFASGVDLIVHPWFKDAKFVSDGGTLESDGVSTKVKWVALRGNIHDWAIYHSMDANFTHADYLDSPEHLSTHPDRILRGGAKLHNTTAIQRIVPCTQAALNFYRF